MEVGESTLRPACVGDREGGSDRGGEGGGGGATLLFSQAPLKPRRGLRLSHMASRSQRVWLIPPLGRTTAALRTAI